MLQTLATLFTGILAMVGGWFIPSPLASVASSTGAAATITAALPTGSSWLTTLPLGDSHYVTSAPKKGYIYLCHVQAGGEGAKGTPTWIHGTTWNPSAKVAVEGAVAWPSAVYSMKVSGATRLIASNGLPTDHTTGIFPIQKSDPAYQFDANPNSIKAQQYSFSLPASPTEAATPNCIYGEVGIMNDGVPLFDGFDAEYRDAVAHETQDAYDAHPDESGVYHYHGFEDSVMKNTAVSTVVGFAFDGYPITGGKLPSGNYLTTNDLDECHGLTSTITLDGKQVSTYHYVLTQDFPYSVGCFHGKSYEPKPGGAGGSSSAGSATVSGANTGSAAQGGTPPTPPQAAIDACTGKSSGATCSVGSNVTGTCATIGSSFACKPS